MLDRHIPVIFQEASPPGPHCDPLDVELFIIQNVLGEDLEYRWRAMAGERVQLECDDFYDLYYRYDAPNGLDLRVMTQDYVGRTLFEGRGHVCIEWADGH